MVLILRNTGAVRALSQNVLLTSDYGSGKLTLRRRGDELQTWERPAPLRLSYPEADIRA